MENSNKIIPPHLNAEIYRKETTGTNTQSYLDYVRIHQDRSILVGCSELTGRYWNGGACIFKNNETQQNISNIAKRDIYLKSSTPDGCFTGSSTKVILCDDTGGFSIWSRNDEAWKIWNQELCVAEHDSAVLTIQSLEQDKSYITSGGDGNVKVWDINESMLCIKNYCSAHTLPIHALSVKPLSHSHFVTGSLDCYISLWDEHTDKPVYDIFENDCGIRCLQWIEEYKIIFGDEAGMLHMVDTRNSDTTIKLHEFPAPVHQLAFNPGNNNVAVCCDNKKVSVFNIRDEKVNLIQEESKHLNYVRGVAWDTQDQNILYSVGWDGNLNRTVVNQ